MSDQRKACLQQLRDVSDCRVVLITPETLPAYVVPDVPIHPAYPYLSEVHKADYLRAYLMHVHGGGYADIKLTMGSWVRAFRDMERNPTAYINGYIGGPNVSAPELASEWQVLVGVCQFIVRPRTEFTQAWYSEVCRVLDTHLDALRAHPATHPYDYAPSPSGYPLAWTEVLGSILNRVQYTYRDRTMFTCPNHYRSHYR